MPTSSRSSTSGTRQVSPAPGTTLEPTSAVPAQCGRSCCSSPWIRGCSSAPSWRATTGTVGGCTTSRVQPARRGEGIGRRLVHEAEARLVALGCPKVMLMVRAGNDAVLAFYDGLDYTREATSLTGKRLIPDD